MTHPIVRMGFLEHHRRYLASEQASVDYVNEVVDGRGMPLYLDSSFSMSALTETEAAAQLMIKNQNQLRRIHNGS